jgi:hypothetical protein
MNNNHNNNNNTNQANLNPSTFFAQSFNCKITPIVMILLSSSCMWGICIYTCFRDDDERTLIAGFLFKPRDKDGDESG